MLNSHFVHKSLYIWAEPYSCSRSPFSPWSVSPPSPFHWWWAKLPPSPPHTHVLKRACHPPIDLSHWVRVRYPSAPSVSNTVPSHLPFPFFKFFLANVSFVCCPVFRSHSHYWIIPVIASRLQGWQLHPFPPPSPTLLYFTSKFQSAPTCFPNSPSSM